MTDPLTIMLTPEATAILAENVKVLLLEELNKVWDDRLSSGPYMNVSEAADYLRCSRQRIHDLLSAGKLDRFKDGSRTLVLRDQLESYVRGV